MRPYEAKQKKGTELKLSRNWNVPWVIVKRLSNTLYQILHSKTSKPKIVHGDNLESFRKHMESELNVIPWNHKS